jgi:hypothetical protein
MNVWGSTHKQIREQAGLTINSTARGLWSNGLSSGKQSMEDSIELLHKSAMSA